MRWMVVIVVACSLLSGCARLPTMYSDDGAVLHFSGKKLRHSVPGQADTLCQFDKQTQLHECDDGTSSTLILAGLPFYGVVLAEFDGRRFRKPVEDQSPKR
jgi:hypothetical protein